MNIKNLAFLVGTLSLGCSSTNLTEEQTAILESHEMTFQGECIVSAYPCDIDNDNDMDLIFRTSGSGISREGYYLNTEKGYMGPYRWEE